MLYYNKRGEIAICIWHLYHIHVSINLWLFFEAGFVRPFHFLVLVYIRSLEFLFSFSYIYRRYFLYLYIQCKLWPTSILIANLTCLCKIATYRRNIIIKHHASSRLKADHNRQCVREVNERNLTLTSAWTMHRRFCNVRTTFSWRFQHVN